MPSVVPQSLLTENHALCDVRQPARQIAVVRRLQRRVGWRRRDLHPQIEAIMRTRWILMLMPYGVVHQSEIEQAVQEVERTLKPAGVRYIHFDISKDWSGDWAVFFRILLADS